MTVPIPARHESARPFWSIVIPTHAPDLALLRQTLDSVRQSGLDLAAHQVAIVDDASPEPAVAAFLDEQAAQGFEVYRNAERRGLVGNWNACLTHARGQWVHILHQDDRVRPGFYAALEEGIRQAPTCGAACTQTAFVDEAGRWLRDGHLRQTAPGLLQDWIEHVVVNLAIQCPAMVVRRAVYERLGGFDPRFAYCSDADMWSRLAPEYPIWFDPRPLAEYRVHPASATYRDYHLTQRWRERRQCLAQAIPRLSPVIRPRVRSAGHHYLTRLAWQEWKTAWHGETRGIFRLALLPALARIGKLRDLLAIHRRRYPEPVPSQTPIREVDPYAPRRPRVLLLSEFYPYPPEKAVFGVFQRLRRNMEALARVGQLDAVFFWSDNYQVPDSLVEEHRQQLAAHWPLSGALRIIATSTGQAAEFHRHPVRALYWMLRGTCSFMQAQPSLRCCGPGQVALLRRWLHLFQPDLIFAHRLGTVGPLIRLRQPLPPVILDLDDVEHIKMLRLHTHSVPRFSRVRAGLRAALAILSERRAAALVRATLVCSESDRRALQQVVPRARIEILPNTARSAEPLPPAPEPTAIFVGVAYYPPNRDAIQWLVSDIWPRVRARIPSARLLVVGEGAADAVGAAGGTGVEVVGFATELEAEYRRAGVAVCPIRRGSGTRIKIIEAALYQRPTVSTTIGAEGLSFEPGREIMIADDAERFADACITLLSDATQREKIGQAALHRARQDYAPEKVVNHLAQLLQGHLARPLEHLNERA